MLFSEKLELKKEVISSGDTESVTGSFTLFSKQDCVASSTRPCYDKQTGKKIVGLEAKGGEKAFAACLKGKAIGSSGSYMVETPICDQEKFLYCYDGKSKVFLRKFGGFCGESQPEPQPSLNCPRATEFYPLSFLDTSWSMSSPTQNYWLTTMFKSKSGTLFAAGFKLDYTTYGIIYGGYLPVMYKSTDNGVSWNSVNLPYSETDLGSWVMVLSMAEDKNGVLYAGGHKLWKSVDGGNTWSTLPLPYPNNYWGGYTPITNMLVTKDNSLIASFYDTFVVTGPSDPYYFRPKVSRSTDGGNRWNEIFSHDYFITSVVEADDGSLVFRDSIGGNPGSVYRYANGIVTKTFTDGPAAMDYDAGFLKASNGNIYLISPDKSADINVVDYTQTGTAYLAAYKSTDNGMTWTKLGVLPNSWELQGKIVEASDGTMYATSWSNCYRAETIYKSEDKGVTWNIIASSPIFGKGKHADPYFRYAILSYVEVSGKILNVGNAPVVFSTP